MKEDDRYKWFHDHINPDFIQLHSLKQVLYSGHTRFQSIDIVDTASFGVCLILDGKIQSAQSDEFIYHEALVQPAMVAHPAPKKVLIAGAGEGAALREVLAHGSVDKVIAVDIDGEVVDVCRRFLPSFHRGAFEDARVKLIIGDARKYIETSREKFDVIILDLVDPMEGGPAGLLYTQEFYELIKARLTADGIVAVQSGPAGLLNWKAFGAIVHTLKTVFPVASPYQTHVPSFCDTWGWVFASNGTEPRKLASREIDRRLRQRLSHLPRFYDGLTHQALFTLPRHLRKHLAGARRLITDDNPIFAY